MQKPIAIVRTRPALALFCLAAVVRLVWVLTLDDALAWPDEREFAAIAERLAAGDGYVSNSYRANPILPGYLAIFVWAFGPHWLLPRIGQALIGAASCVLLFRLTGLLAGPLAAGIAGLMLALYPAHVYLSGVFYVDCLSTLLLLLSILLAVQAASSSRPFALAAMAGAAIGTAALARATSLVCAPALAAALACSLAGSRRRALAAATILAVSAAIVVAPWAVRNTRYFGRPMLVSSGLWETVWKGNNEIADGGPDDRNMVWGTPLWESRIARLESAERSAIVAKYDRIASEIADRYAVTGDVYIARDDVLGPVARELIVADPLRFADLCVRKLFTLFDAFSDTELDNADTSVAKRMVAAATFYPLLVLALAGFGLSLPGFRRFAPVSLTLLSVVGLYAALTACTRFRLPLDPLLMVFAGSAVERAWTFVAARRERPLAGSAPALRAGT
jgi:hypothetical protein